MRLHTNIEAKYSSHNFFTVTFWEETYDYLMNSMTFIFMIISLPKEVVDNLFASPKQIDR